MKNFNAFDSSLLFMITFSHPSFFAGQSTKEMYAPSFDEACEIARDVVNYPMEYPDYDRMNIVITDQKTYEAIDFNELPNII